MIQYQYLIVGGGMTADAAAEGIREADPSGTIGLISDDEDPPYNRPPLSKGLWKGESYGYRKLLLATGGTVRRLPFGGDEIIYFRALRDYRRLRRADRLSVRTAGGRDIPAEAVVAGIGIAPATALAAEAGIAVEDGIVVDETLRTSQPDVYAAGDVASFESPALGRRIRVEHEDNALTMGRQAGRNLAGQVEPYRHLPFFYSDLFDLGYEAVGELDARHQTVADWKEPFREGVVYYLKDGRVRGVLLWNTWGQVDAARALITQPGPFRPPDLKGRLPASA